MSFEEAPYPNCPKLSVDENPKLIIIIIQKKIPRIWEKGETKLKSNIIVDQEIPYTRSEATLSSQRKLWRSHFS